MLQSQLRKGDIQVIHFAQLAIQPLFFSPVSNSFPAFAHLVQYNFFFCHFQIELDFFPLINASSLFKGLVIEITVGFFLCVFSSQCRQCPFPQSFG